MSRPSESRNAFRNNYDDNVRNRAAIHILRHFNDHDMKTPVLVGASPLPISSWPAINKGASLGPRPPTLFASELQRLSGSELPRRTK